MVSMKDIAAACHVSVATVSKALNGHRDISEETKLHIKKVAKDMGYFPNSVARALKTNKTFNIGVLFVEEAHSGLTHNYFSHLLDSFKVTAEAQGYDITFLNCNKQRKDRMSYLEHSRYRGFDGVVIACVNFEDPEVIELIESNLPVVTIDRIFPNRISIVSDNEKGITDLVSYIIEKKHTKIAYIHGRDSAVTRQRLAGFREVMKQHDIVVPNAYIRETDYRDIQRTAIATAAFEATGSANLHFVPGRLCCIWWHQCNKSRGAPYSGRYFGGRIRWHFTGDKDRAEDDNDQAGHQDDGNAGSGKADRTDRETEYDGDCIHYRTWNPFTGSDSCKPIMAFISHK